MKNFSKLEVQKPGWYVLREVYGKPGDPIDYEVEQGPFSQSIDAHDAQRDIQSSTDRFNYTVAYVDKNGEVDTKNFSAKLNNFSRRLCNFANYENIIHIDIPKKAARKIINELELKDVDGYGMYQYGDLDYGFELVRLKGGDGTYSFTGHITPLVSRVLKENNISFSQEENFNNWVVTNTTRNQVVFKGTQEECEDFAGSKNEGNNSKVPVYVAHPSESTNFSYSGPYSDLAYVLKNPRQAYQMARDDISRRKHYGKLNDFALLVELGKLDIDKLEGIMDRQDYLYIKSMVDVDARHNTIMGSPKDHFKGFNFSQIDGNSEAFKAGRTLAESETGLDRDALDAKAKDAGYEGDDSTNFKFGYNSKDKKAENFSSNASFSENTDNVNGTEVHNMEGENQVIEDLVAEDLAAGIKDGSEDFSAACTLYSKKYGVNFSQKYKKVFSERYKKDNFSEDTDEKFELITEVLGKVVSSIEALRDDLDKIQKPEPTESTEPTTTEGSTENENMSEETYVAINTKTGKKTFTGTKKECDDWLLEVFGNPKNVSTAPYVVKPESSYKKENMSEDESVVVNTKTSDEVKFSGRDKKTLIALIKEKLNSNPSNLMKSQLEDLLEETTQSSDEQFQQALKNQGFLEMVKSLEINFSDDELNLKDSGATDDPKKPTDNMSDDNSKAWYDGNTTAKNDGSTENTDARAEELAGTFGYEKGSKEFSEFIEGFKSGIDSTPKSEDDSEDPETANFSQNDIQTRYNTLKGMFSSNDF